MIRALATAKVDFTQKNNDGFTALDVAEGKQPAGRQPGARGGGPPGGGRGRRTRRESQQDVAKLLRELMGLPPAPPAAPADHRGSGAPAVNEGALRGREHCSSRRRVSTTPRRAGARPVPQQRPSRRSRRDRSAAPKAGPQHRRRSRTLPVNYQEMVTKYCVGCHNTRNPLPAGAPLALDKANLADPGADAATWERVVKKLGVGAMPPQGSPTPGARGADASSARRSSPASTPRPRRRTTRAATCCIA